MDQNSVYSSRLKMYINTQSTYHYVLNHSVTGHYQGGGNFNTAPAPLPHTDEYPFETACASAGDSSAATSNIHESPPTSAFQGYA
jgi:hypothetical protein